MLTLLDQPAYKEVELLKLSGSLTFEESTAQLVQRLHSGKTKEDYKLQLRARCQRPNEDFEVIADNVQELVENAYTWRQLIGSRWNWQEISSFKE